MKRRRTLSIEPPVGGLARSMSVKNQDRFTTVSALNCWPTHFDESGVDSSTAPVGNQGRVRLSARPSIKTGGVDVTGTPLSASPAAWTRETGGAPKESAYGVIVTTSSGAEIIEADGSAGRSLSGTTTSGDLADSCVGLNTMFLTSQSFEHIETKDLEAASASPEEIDDSLSGADYVASGTKYPTYAGLCTVWQQRLVVAGLRDAGRQIWFSQTGNWKGWDYTEFNADSAVILEVNGIATSLIPFNEQILLVGCTDSMYALTSNPARGGFQNQLTRSIAPLSQSAWCRSPDADSLWFISRNGLYRMSGGSLNIPQAVSEDVLPGSLRNLDPDDATVAIGYDNKYRGLVIMVEKSGSDDEFWFYHIPTGSFWPMTASPTWALCYDVPGRRSDTESSLQMWNTTGLGYVFEENPAAAELMTTYAYVGPIPLAPTGKRGKVLSVEGVLAESPVSSNHGDDHDIDNADQVSWTLYTGESAQQAFFNPTGEYVAEENWTRTGLNHAESPLLAGNAAFVKVEGASTGSRWSLEEIRMTVMEHGSQKAML